MQNKKNNFLNTKSMMKTLVIDKKTKKILYILKKQYQTQLTTKFLLKQIYFDILENLFL